MSAPGKPLSVGWKVPTLAAGIASVRYRAVLPMLALEGAEVHSRLFRSGLESNLDGLHVLVIVKSFTADDIRLAQLAAARGIGVVYDLCDNIFIPGYAGRSNVPPPAQVFLQIVQHANCVVTTTEPLAQAIRQRAPDLPVVVIPDGMEGEDTGARIAAVLREAAAGERSEGFRVARLRVGNAMGRVRTEGVGVLPSMVGLVARRVGGALVRRARHAAHARPQAAASSPRPSAASAPARPGASRIVWFGNHGADYAEFGMLDILEYRAALEAVAAEREVELVVISNNEGKYRQAILPLAIPSRYVEWSSAAVERELQQAAVVIVPNSGDAFSICKSANRTVLALHHGVPVVATRTPALQPVADFVHTGEPLAELRKVLAQPAAARATAVEGGRWAEAVFGLQSIQEQWLRLLRELPRPDSGAATTQPELAVVLHLIQDLDLALPILKEARRAGIPCEAWCSSAVVMKSPRVLPALKAEQIRCRVLPGDQALRNYVFPAATRVLLTVAETNLGPHRVPRLLTEAAVRQGLFVATLQHGFENVGLTSDDRLQGMDKVDIAAHRIYTWGPLETLHSRIPAGVRARCLPVGCPKPARPDPAPARGLLPPDRTIVGIFENLHWHRYDEAYRAAFIANIEAVMHAFPEVLFVLKPHHAGMWTTRQYQGEKPAGDNLLLVDPQAPGWENHTAAALLPHMQAVVTSPSTVALDAARLDLPVAIAAGSLHLDNYRPLSLLTQASEWIDFVAAALQPQRRAALQQQSARFVERVLVPGDAARRIVADLHAMAGA